MKGVNVLIETLAQLRKVVLPWLDKVMTFNDPAFAADTETRVLGENEVITLKNEGLLLDRGRIMLISLCRKKKKFSIPTSSFDPRFPKTSDVIAELKPYFESKKVRKVFHHANYDVNMFLNHGVKVRNYWCTLVAGACQDENVPRSLADRALAVGFLLRKAKKSEERKELFTNLKKLAPYAETDAEATWCVYQAQRFGTVPKLRGRRPEDVAALQLKGRRLRFFKKIEMPVLRVVINMERRGMKINRKRLGKVDAEIESNLARCLRKIYEVNGKPFNVRSRDQLSDLLFEKLKLIPHKTTNSGKYSTDKESLLYMKAQHPIIQTLIERSQYEKLRDYTHAMKGLTQYADIHGHIHPTLNSAGTVTFRMSCSNPNLQNIPSKQDKFGIRKCFIASKGNVLIVADYNQLELRIMGILSEDPNLVRAYRKGLDIHDQTMQALGISIRTIAKNCNFGLCYKGSAWMLARLLTMDGIPTTPEQASGYRDKWLSTYSGIPRFWDEVSGLHREQGYVLNLCGRPRVIPDINHSSKRMRSAAERQLVNNIVQGSAADLIKAAMLRIEYDEELRDLGYFMTMQIHDELVGECPEKNAERASKRVTELMELLPDRLIKKPPLPIKASVGIGPSWQEAKK